MTEQEQQALCRRIMGGASQPGWFSNQLKIVYDHLDSRSAEGHIVAEKEHCNPFNIVHGGVYYTLMDQLAGMATAATGRGGVTLDANVSYLKSARAGETVRHRNIPPLLPQAGGDHDGGCGVTETGSGAFVLRSADFRRLPLKGKALRCAPAQNAKTKPF